MFEPFKSFKFPVRDRRGRFLPRKYLGITFGKGRVLLIKCTLCGTQERLPTTWLDSRPDSMLKR